MIKEFIELESPNPYARKISYFIDDKQVGYLDYSLIYDRIEIDNFFVDENYRNQGIGKKLLSYLVVIGINNHVINITLEVRKSNEVAINFYKKNGYKIVSTRKNYYKDEDGYLMLKELGE